MSTNTHMPYIHRCTTETETKRSLSQTILMYFCRFKKSTNRRLTPPLIKTWTMRKLHLPVPKSSQLLSGSFTFLRKIRSLSDFFKEVQRSLQFGIAFIQLQDSVTRWPSPQEPSEIIIFPGSRCSQDHYQMTLGKPTVRTIGSLMFITAGDMATNLTTA